jgi:DNA-binding NarL/FixJ family response regulator
MLKLLLADDHQVVRQALRSLLEPKVPCMVVGEAADGLEALTLLDALKPDQLILDMQMPGLSGLEVIKHARQRQSSTNIVVLSMHGNEGYVREAMRAGASAYVLKEAAAEELIHAVREAAAGRRFLSTALSERAIDAYIQQVTGPNLDLYDTLSEREREVLFLSAQGITTAEIAKRLVISVRTVESFRSKLMRKLDLRNQTDLVRYALRRGIIPLE